MSRKKASLMAGISQVSSSQEIVEFLKQVVSLIEPLAGSMTWPSRVSMLFCCVILVKERRVKSNHTENNFLDLFGSSCFF